MFKDPYYSCHIGRGFSTRDAIAKAVYEKVGLLTSDEQHKFCNLEPTNCRVKIPLAQTMYILTLLRLDVPDVCFIGSNPEDFLEFEGIIGGAENQNFFIKVEGYEIDP